MVYIVYGAKIIVLMIDRIYNFYDLFSDLVEKGAAKPSDPADGIFFNFCVDKLS